MMLRSFLKSDSLQPLHSQINDAVRLALKLGLFSRKGFPSIKELCNDFDVSSVTINRALNPLIKEGIIELSHRKKFRVKENRELRVLLIFNRISSFKRIIYNGLVDSLGTDWSVDLKLHNYSLLSLKEILSKNIGLYDKYVVMPPFRAANYS